MTSLMTPVGTLTDARYPGELYRDATVTTPINLQRFEFSGSPEQRQQLFSQAMISLCSLGARTGLNFVPLSSLFHTLTLESGLDFFERQQVLHRLGTDTNTTDSEQRQKTFIWQGLAAADVVHYLKKNVVDHSAALQTLFADHAVETCAHYPTYQTSPFLRFLAMEAIWGDLVCALHGNLEIGTRALRKKDSNLFLKAQSNFLSVSAVLKEKVLVLADEMDGIRSVSQRMATYEPTNTFLQGPILKEFGIMAGHLRVVATALDALVRREGPALALCA